MVNTAGFAARASGLCRRIYRKGFEPPDRVVNRGPDDDEPPLFTKEFFEAQMGVVIQERVPVYASGLETPGLGWMNCANGTKVMAVVGAVRHAIQVKSSGLDIIAAVTMAVATTRR